MNKDLNSVNNLDTLVSKAMNNSDVALGVGLVNFEDYIFSTSQTDLIFDIRTEEPIDVMAAYEETYLMTPSRLALNWDIEISDEPSPETEEEPMIVHSFADEPVAFGGLFSADNPYIYDVGRSAAPTAPIVMTPEQRERYDNGEIDLQGNEIKRDQPPPPQEEPKQSTDAEEDDEEYYEEEENDSVLFFPEDEVEIILDIPETDEEIQEEDTDPISADPVNNPEPSNSDVHDDTEKSASDVSDDHSHDHDDTEKSASEDEHNADDGHDDTEKSDSDDGPNPDDTEKSASDDSHDDDHEHDDTEKNASDNGHDDDHDDDHAHDHDEGIDIHVLGPEIDFFTAVLHEIGHALGLQHETSGAPSIMAPYYNGPVTGLYATDIANIQALYPESGEYIRGAWRDTDLTYSFMPDGTHIFNDTSNMAETLSRIFETEEDWQGLIEEALQEWADATIEDGINVFLAFTEVFDSGVSFNTYGAQGDLRFGMRDVDGPGGVVATGYLPPPNGLTAAGDVILDYGENWVDFH